MVNPWESFPPTDLLSVLLLPMHAHMVHVYDMIRLHCLLSFTVCTHEDLGVVDIIPDERCPGLQNSAQFTGGFVCYSGLTPGAVAVYVCNSTHHLEDSPFRECQSNGSWSESAPQCVEGQSNYNRCKLESPFSAPSIYRSLLKQLCSTLVGHSSLQLCTPWLMSSKNLP